MSSQKKILLFVHDGSGLGHLRRVARIASYLQGPYACLIVTGHRQASWIVPPTCEILYLPNWHSFSQTKSKYWDRNAWFSIEKKDVYYMRTAILKAVIDSFNPDIIIVDYLPFGKEDELKNLLINSKSRKYLVLRGIIDTSDRKIFCGQSSIEIANIFDEVIVTADRRIIDVSIEYFQHTPLESKIRYVGYIIPSKVDSYSVRQNLNINENALWVVCSGGGGKNAETFLIQCIGLAREFHDVNFDIVFGPLANVRRAMSFHDLPDNCRVHLERHDLSEMHSSCDIVIGSGGYNSIMEAIGGGAAIIVNSCKGEGEDEPIENVVRMEDYYLIKKSTNTDNLNEILASTIRVLNLLGKPSFSMDTNGLENIKQLISKQNH